MKFVLPFKNKDTIEVNHGLNASLLSVDIDFLDKSVYKHIEHIKVNSKDDFTIYLHSKSSGIVRVSLPEA